MSKLFLFITIALLLTTWRCSMDEYRGKLESGCADYVVVLHGGAGWMSPENTPPEKQQQIQAAMYKALDTAEAILSTGGLAVDAVESAIMILEDSPLFNAGKGAVMTHDGQHELDASIMDGREVNAGAVTGVMNTKNPIQAARMVMDSSVHVFLAGAGADAFAARQGLTWVENSYFDTEKSRAAWEKAQKKMGTVGCVVKDKLGNLAAGTSTGGMSNKRWNRIGDSPVIGAGTYAENGYAAVSCTGHGEYFIRHVIAYDVVARMKHAGVSLYKATTVPIYDILSRDKGAGGLIAVDKDGRVETPFNTPGMYRAISRAGNRSIGFFEQLAEQ